MISDDAHCSRTYRSDSNMAVGELTVSLPNKTLESHSAADLSSVNAVSASGEMSRVCPGRGLFLMLWTLWWHWERLIVSLSHVSVQPVRSRPWTRFLRAKPCSWEVYLYGMGRCSSASVLTRGAEWSGDKRKWNLALLPDFFFLSLSSLFLYIPKWLLTPTRAQNRTNRFFFFKVCVLKKKIFNECLFFYCTSNKLKKSTYYPMV